MPQALAAAIRKGLDRVDGITVRLIADLVRVVDEEMRDVPQDGATMGEVVMRGNNVMLGYYKDTAATDEAFKGGWFHSGDLAVIHPDNYIQIMDRKKDIIISGGENISCIEVEEAIYAHDAVAECSVFGVPDERFGEIPAAVYLTHPGKDLSPEEYEEVISKANNFNSGRS